MSAATDTKGSLPSNILIAQEYVFVSPDPKPLLGGGGGQRIKMELCNATTKKMAYDSTVFRCALFCCESKGRYSYLLISPLFLLWIHGKPSFLMKIPKLAAWRETKWALTATPTKKTQNQTTKKKKKNPQLKVLLVTWVFGSGTANR